jgi:hypothetical protein
MSTKNQNPYREGSQYHGLFGFIRKAQVVVRSAVLAHAKEIGMTEDAAEATATVILSPREWDGKDADANGVLHAKVTRIGEDGKPVVTSSKGDCRGNMSAAGHIYFMEKLAKKDGEEQRFRLRYYKTELPPHKREREVKAVKTAKTNKATATAATA